MAIIEYKEYEHGGGFVGFRVARTVGTESDYRQKYFSLQYYTRKQAKELAQKLNDEWAEEAKSVVKLTYSNYTRKQLGKHHIAHGFRASITANERIRAGELRTYFSPCFIVNVPRGKRSISFRTPKLGYEKAFSEAVKKYGELHNLNKSEISDLIAKLPKIELFTKHLLNKLRYRGLKLSKGKLLELLNQKKSA